MRQKWPQTTLSEVESAHRSWDTTSSQYEGENKFSQHRWTLASKAYVPMSDEPILLVILLPKESFAAIFDSDITKSPV